jgi:superfamily II DNA or RNA helicase
MDLREYQSDATKESLLSLRQHRELTWSFDDFWGFIEMATWSGKTLVEFKTLDYILRVRERYNRLHPNIDTPSTKVAILSHRIDATEQLYQDFFEWRNWHLAIWSKEICDISWVKMFHSQALNTQIKVWSRIEFIFSTFQTAEQLNNTNIKDADIVVIDDIHVITPGSDYFHVLEKIVSWKKQPIILGNTATPDDFTRELFWEPLYRYTLPEYLASEHSPSLEYHFISHKGIQDTEIEALLGEIEELSRIEDKKRRKRKFTSVQKRFNALLSQHETVTWLVQDALSRLMIDTPDIIEPTLIFCPSQETADQVAITINKTLWISDLALSYHSWNDSNKGLIRLSDKQDPCRILVVVDKMNEGIDAPAIQNVVFWRSTNSSKIFLQQFGRWLRGKKHVRYFDYIWGLSNFIAVHKIYQEYREFSWDEQMDTGDAAFTDPRDKFHLIGMNTGTRDNPIDMSILGLRLARIHYGIETSRMVTRDELRTLLLNRELSPHHISSHSEWVKFSKMWNNTHSLSRWFHLPRTLKWLFKAVDPNLENFTHLTSMLIQIILWEEQWGVEIKMTQQYKDDKYQEIKDLIQKGILTLEALYSIEGWTSWFANAPKKRASFLEIHQSTYADWQRHLREISQDSILEVYSNYSKSEYYIWGVRVDSDSPSFIYNRYDFKPHMNENVGLSIETVTDWLNGKDTKIHIKPLITSDKFRWLLDTDDEVNNIFAQKISRMPVLSQKWNRTVWWKKWVRLPCSVRQAIQLLWWDWSRSSGKYLQMLVRWDTDSAIPMREARLRFAWWYEVFDLLEEGVIPREIFLAYEGEHAIAETRVLVDAWNDQYAAHYGFRLCPELTRHFLSTSADKEARKILATAILSQRFLREFYLIKRRISEFNSIST